MAVRSKKIAPRKRPHIAQDNEERSLSSRKAVKAQIASAPPPAIEDDLLRRPSIDRTVEHWVTEGNVWPSPRSDDVSRCQILRQTESPCRTRSTSRSTIRTESDLVKRLRQRKIYVEVKDIPENIKRKARKILCDGPHPLETDINEAEKLCRTMGTCVHAFEGEIVKVVEGHILPKLGEADSAALQIVTKRPWVDHVPVPFGRFIPRNNGGASGRLPLNTPQPDLLYGFREGLFTDEDQGLFMSLVDGNERSYAAPDGYCWFPFFLIEYKSQATGGTLYSARNQAAKAGAVIIHSKLEMARRFAQQVELDLARPLFFSANIDQQMALINIHWVEEINGDYHYHLTKFSTHLWEIPGVIIDFRHRMKNLLAWATGEWSSEVRTMLADFRRQLRDGQTFEEQDGAAHGHVDLAQASNADDETGLDGEETAQPRASSSQRRGVQDRPSRHHKLDGKATPATCLQQQQEEEEEEEEDDDDGGNGKQDALPAIFRSSAREDVRRSTRLKEKVASCARGR